MRRYPIVFDETIREQTEACSDKEKRKQIREFASMTATGFKHQVDSHVRFCENKIFFCLFLSNQATIRSSIISYLSQSSSSSITYRGFATNSRRNSIETSSEINFAEIETIYVLFF